MNEGWVKLHRSIVDWEWWDEPKTLKVFLCCLVSANHTEKRWRGIVIPRGSFVTSFDNLSKLSGMSVKSVRTALNKLENTQEVARQKNAHYTLISVTNYDHYQGEGQAERQGNGTLKGKPRATTKNEKNDKNEKKEKILVQQEMLNEFNSFYNLYPRKQGKKQALASFIKARGSGIMLNEIIKGVEEYVKHKPDYQDWAMPSTWLNQERWNDQYAPRADYAKIMSKYNSVQRSYLEQKIKEGDDAFVRKTTGYGIADILAARR